jgi:predicted RNA-binding protein with PUA-like domain
MRYWLMKTEPKTFSIADLKRVRESLWDGVRNYQARNFMMQAMQLGDTVLIYHSNCKEPAIVGEAIVAKRAIPDPTQFDPHSQYYDPKSKRDKPRWYGVTVRYKCTYKKPITLATLRNAKALHTMLILRPGNRLSITPVTAREYQLLSTML